MKENIYLPRMGQTMTEGSVVKWLKSNGEAVKKGEDIVEIMTDKVTTEVESPKDGILKILIKEEKTIADIANQYQVHPNQVSAWKSETLTKMPDLVQDGRKKQKSKGIGGRKALEALVPVQIYP